MRPYLRNVSVAVPGASFVLVLVLVLEPTSAFAQAVPTGTASALFADATSASGLDGVPGGQVTLYDLDGDGWPDAIIDRTRIFWNRPAGDGRRFVPLPGSGPGVAAGPRTPVCIQPGDLDGDGRTDLFVARSIPLTASAGAAVAEGPRSEVWLADGEGGFRLKRDSGVGRYAEATMSACLVDYDRDGALDAFLGQTYVPGKDSYEAFPPRLYRGRGDGTFEETTERAGLLGVAAAGRADSRRPTYGVAHADWNDDGLPDLLGMSYGRQWNRLWRNNGDGTFTDVAPATGFDGDEDRSGVYPPGADGKVRAPEPPFRSNGNTFDAAVVDVDGDGDMDCFLAEIAHFWAGPSSDRSMLLENLGAAEGFRFRRRPELIRRMHATERWNEGDLGAGWLDVDNDGRLDLLIASSDYPDDQILRLFRQTESAALAFEEWTGRLGFVWRNAQQISLGDFDRDGATDILAGTNDSRLTPAQRAAHRLNVGLWRNRAAAGNGFLSLRLAGGGGKAANRDAIGARVTIFADGRRQTREVYGGQGHGGHRDDPEVRFGLGKATKVDRLIVRWPDRTGMTQEFRDVAASRFYRLVQGGSLEAVPTGPGR